MTVAIEQSRRWIWFIDVVFGAIVALGIQNYESALREAWSVSFGQSAVMVVVGVSIFSFVVYDIAVYHALVKRFPFRMTSLGFLRIYIDLVMAFTLYLLMSISFELRPDWMSVIMAVTFWHLLALFWHYLAHLEYLESDIFGNAVISHAMFISYYWIAALFAMGIGGGLFGLYGTVLSSCILIAVSFTILVVSIIRWKKVISMTEVVGELT